MNTAYRRIITLAPGKQAGRPGIRGTRITVYDVLSSVSAGITQEEILADFRYYTAGDIRACLSHAPDRAPQTLLAQA